MSATILRIQRPQSMTCCGCDQSREDVGPLVPCRVGYRDGSNATVEYCDECRDMAFLAVARPGEAYGAASLPDNIASISLLTSSTYEVVVRLSPAGAVFLGESTSRRLEEGACVSVLLNAPSSIDAAKDAADFGDVVAVAPCRDRHAHTALRRVS